MLVVEWLGGAVPGVTGTWMVVSLWVRAQPVMCPAVCRQVAESSVIHWSRSALLGRSPG
ncbi:hypothetical protein NKH18_13925 [Streptomyces sp. M10(2022)]